MEPVKKIYTGSGDDGSTSLKGGLRVAKTDIRIEVNGSIDEANTAIGLVRAFMDSDSDYQPILRQIQISMMKTMSFIASIRTGDHELTHLDLDVESIERQIDSITTQISDDGFFVVPGGTKLSALIHHARVSVRKSERILWRMNAQYPLPCQLTKYFNRLSDLLFVMARSEQQRSGLGEEKWKIFGTRR